MNWHTAGQQLYFGLVNGAVYVLIASGMTLIFGVMNVVNMAHGELAMLGAMLVFTLTSVLGWPFFASAAAAIIALSIIGAIANRVAVTPLMGRSPLTVLLSTLAVSYILLNGAVAIWTNEPRVVEAPFQQVYRPGGIAVSGQSLMLLGVTFLAMVSLYLLIYKTALGRSMRATSQNLIGAKVVGINTLRVYDVTFAIAAALAALAGIFMLATGAYHPYMGQPLLIMGFAVVIVAGMGHVWGVVLLGFAFGILEAFFGQYVDTYFRQPFIYSLMVLVLLLRPQGLFGRR